MGRSKRRATRSLIRWAAVIILSLVLVAPTVSTGFADAPDRVLDPVGGGYTTGSLQGFASTVAAHATGQVVKIVVIPSSYGTSPSLPNNVNLASKRTKEIAAACNAVVDRETFPQGCQATLLMLFTREQAEDPANSAALSDPETDGAFILGGDQDLAMQVLANTPAEETMAAAYNRGVVFGGTSAGDAVESRTMIADYANGGGPDTALEKDKVLIWWGDNAGTERGLSFGSERAVFGQHFYQRGREGRLLNTVARSIEHFGGNGLLGIGVDFGTGVNVTNDSRLDNVFGASSAMVIDMSGATPAWNGPNQTLSVRDVLTSLIAPGDYAYDMVNRTPLAGNVPVTFDSARLAWQPDLLTDPGNATLILGGDVTGDFSGPAFNAFVSRAETAAGSDAASARILIVATAYQNSGQAVKAGNLYATALQADGWTGTVEVIPYLGTSSAGSLPLSKIDGASGVLFIGGDQQYLPGSLQDGHVGQLVRHALDVSPVVMTDRAMTAAMGSIYVANPDPTSANYQDSGIADFQAGHDQIVAGLNIIPGAAFQPRLTTDQLWGRLYSLTRASQQTVAFGISEMTALVLSGSGATVAGTRSVVAADAGAATEATGTNGAIVALNVALSLYAPGDAVTP